VRDPVACEIVKTDLRRAAQALRQIDRIADADLVRIDLI